MFSDKEKTISLLLRLGISFSFFYAALGSFINPDAWIGFFPIFLQNFIPGNLLLSIFSVYQIVLGLLLLSGKQLYYSSILATVSLLGIIVFNLGSFDIIFRDITILAAAIVLTIISKKD